MAGAVVLAVGLGWGVNIALSGSTGKASSATPLMSSTSGAPSTAPAAAVVATVQHVNGGCTLGESGEAVQVTLVNDSGTTCAGFGQQLAQSSGGFWAAQNPDYALAVICVMDEGTSSVLTVRDGGAGILGQRLCASLQANGWTEDTQAEQQDARAAASASAASEAAAASASAAAAQASQQAATYQAAQAAVAAVDSAAQTFSGDAQTIAKDAATADTDLKTEQKDAAAGQGDYCSNVSTVDADATGTLAADESGTLGADVQGAGYDLQQVRAGIRALQQDDHALSAYGMSTPDGASTAISNAQQTISKAINSVNDDIDHVAQDVTNGYKIADGLATGSCSNAYAPQNPPTPAAHLS